MLNFYRIIIERLSNNGDIQNTTIIQNFCDDIGATEMILKVLSFKDRNLIQGELLLRVLELFIKLLNNGNKQVQDSIYNYCLVDHRSEMLFTKFDWIIKEEIYILKNEFNVGHDRL